MMDVLVAIVIAVLQAALLFVAVAALSLAVCWGFDFEWSIKIAVGSWSVAMFIYIVARFIMA